jgi:hypothetical protein
MEVPRHFPRRTADSFIKAAQTGFMSAAQYCFIADRLLSAPDCGLLVFGLGNDSELWASCVRERITFVEDDPKFLTSAPSTARVILYSYSSRVGRWSDVPQPPNLVDGCWDYVLVDGPRGFNASCPGRQIPITWARQLATREVFVHDYERPWERELCDRLLGTPVELVMPGNSARGQLAVFSADSLRELLPI